MDKKSKKIQATAPGQRNQTVPRSPLPADALSRTTKTPWGTIIATCCYRKLATREGKRWRLSRGYGVKRFAAYAQAAASWAAMACEGDCMQWYHEYFRVDKSGCGGEGLRLLRGERIVADLRLKNLG